MHAIIWNSPVDFPCYKVNFHILRTIFDLENQIFQVNWTWSHLYLQTAMNRLLRQVPSKPDKTVVLDGTIYGGEAKNIRTWVKLHSRTLKTWKVRKGESRKEIFNIYKQQNLIDAWAVMCRPEVWFLNTDGLPLEFIKQATQENEKWIKPKWGFWSRETLSFTCKWFLTMQIIPKTMWRGSIITTSCCASWITLYNA